MLMFSFKKCKVENCHTYALRDRDICFHHSLDKEAVIDNLIDDLKRTKRIENTSIVNAEFEIVDFSSAFIGFSYFAFCSF